MHLLLTWLNPRVLCLVVGILEHVLQQDGLRLRGKECCIYLCHMIWVLPG